MFNYIFRNRKHPPIGCKYTKYNLVPHFIGDFLLILEDFYNHFISKQF